MSEFDADREVIDAATEGPWEVVANGRIIGPRAARIEDLEFVVKARTRWPVALDEIERLKAENKRLVELLDARDELPTCCENCCGDLASPIKPKWDGSTLRCPNCGVDALDEDR